MPRAMWSGAISFGLVQIPIGLYTAEDQSEGLSLTLLDDKDKSPVGYRHVNKNTGEEVPKERRVKGYEVEKDEYVILTDEDFKNANVKATETIDIHSFVEASEIPIMRFEKPYYLAPTKRGKKAYALLREALSEANKVGIATFVMRQRQHLAALIPQGDALVLEVLRYDDEIKNPKDLELPGKIQDVGISKAELEMAERLVEGMTKKFDTRALRDTYRDDLLKLIKERRAHPEHVPPPPPREEKRGEVVDIMSLLKKSVEERADRGERKAERASAGGNGGRRRGERARSTRSRRSKGAARA